MQLFCQHAIDLCSSTVGLLNKVDPSNSKNVSFLNRLYHELVSLLHQLRLCRCYISLI